MAKICKNSLLLFLLIVGLNSKGVDTLFVESKISDVTVFFQGAQITQQIEQSLSSGNQLLIVDNLPFDIDPNSIQVSQPNNADILSVKHRHIQFNNAKKTKEEIILEEKIESIESQKKDLESELNVYKIEEKILMDNRKLSNGEQSITVDEIRQAADFFHERLNEIRIKKLAISRSYINLNKAIEEINSEINTYYVKRNQIISQIMIFINCKLAQKTNLEVKYYSGSAGWTPLYDFKVKSTNEPMTIGYNANVYQTTGENWEEVNIRLSTGNPSLSGSKPSLKPWYFEQPDPNFMEAKKEGFGSIEGRIYDENSDEFIPFVSVAVYQGDKMVKGTASDFDGNYKLKPLPSGYYDLKVQSVGYTQQFISKIWVNGETVVYKDVGLISGVELQQMEVVEYEAPLIDRDGGASGGTVTSESISKMPMRDASYIATTVSGVDDDTYRGGRSRNTYYYVDGVKVVGSGKLKKEVLLSHSVNKKIIDMEYVIDVPYTIPSDGTDYLLRIKSQQVPVDYVYFTVPKIDSDAFLSAMIVDWASLNLLSAKSSIYFNGTYTGESYIDADQTGDTLEISLGRDQNIVVEREINKKINDKRILGTSVKEVIGYEIEVRNKYSTPIEVIIEDQVPLTQLKTITIDEVEALGAGYDEKTGKLTWKVLLAPNEKKVVSYKYEVKYPI